MKVNINAVHFSADKKLFDFIDKKVKKLALFDESIISADVMLKLENNLELGNKIAEVRLEVPGYDLFAKKQCKTFEEAIDQSIDALRNQIDKMKEKRRS